MPSTSASTQVDSDADIGTWYTATTPVDAFPIPIAPAGVLFRYDEACRAVARAKTIDEVQEITTNAEALRAYARQAKNRQLELDAAEIRIRANRRVGELMSGKGHKVGKAAGARGIGTSAGYDQTRTPDAPPSLAEAGIDKNLAHRARTLAAVPAAKFEKLLGEKRRRQDRRVALDPDSEAQTAAAVPDIEIVPARAAGLAARNKTLTRQVATLKQRVAVLEADVKMWQERAEQAGWKEPESLRPSSAGEVSASDADGGVNEHQSRRS